MILNKKGLIYFSIFLILYVFYCVLHISRTLVFYDYLWLVLRIGISFFLLYQLFLNNKYAYSLGNILYIFFLTFFMLAPLGQYFSNVVFWGADSQKHSILRYTQADLFIILFLATFYLTYNLPYKIFRKTRIIRKNISKPVLFYFILSAIHLLVFLFFMRKVGFPEMLFRLTNRIEDVSSTMDLITGRYVKALSIAAMVYMLKASKNNNVLYSAFMVFNLLLFILINFPTSAARFQIIAAYLGLFLILSNRLSSKYIVTLLFLGGLFIIFPFLEVFRNITSFNELEMSSIGKSISSAFNEAHYDSYQMLVNSINYVAENGITWGKQLIGVFLFFVPRAVWPGKPIGSGAFLAEKMNFTFDNIGMPIMGEAYINFSIVGIVMFAIFFGFICRGLDQVYWLKIKNKDNGLLSHFYPVLIGYFFFMNRGDLMSSFAFIVSLYFAFLTVHLIRKIFSGRSHTEVSYANYY